MGNGYYRTIKTKKLIALLVRRGFISVGGSKHGKYARGDSAEVVIVPRHRVITAGTSQELCKFLEKEHKIPKSDLLKLF